jgi:dolichol-phosphate mannosyltransferase
VHGQRPYLSVVAPCYNEEQGLPEFARRVLGVCRAIGRPFEVVLVNDGSKDRTWEALLALAAATPELVCVNLSRNHGHQLALSAGLSVCRGERVLILDADLQDPPELLPQMLELMDGGADVVFGQRRTRAGETRLKLLTSAAFYRFIGALADVPIPRDTGDFRLISRRALDHLVAMPERHRFIRGMVSWIGFKQVALLYERDARFAGRSGYSYRKLLRLALDGVTGFSTKPLTWASTIGFAFALLAVALFVYSLVGWLVFKTAPGWASIMAGVSLLGSVQLFVLGIFGEYLGRLYDQSKGRPLFIIESVVGGGSRAEGEPPRADADDPPVVEVRLARPVGRSEAPR